MPKANEEATKVELPEGHVEVRVSKKGDEKISKGDYPQTYYVWKDMIVLPLEVAQALEDRGFVEIE